MNYEFLKNAGGAYAAFHVCAPRTRATSLSPRPSRGLFWLLNGSTPMHRGVLCMGGISFGHRQECLYHPWPNPRVAHTLPFMYAPHEHGPHLSCRVLAVACSDFLTLADMKGNVGATRDPAVNRVISVAGN